MCVENVNLKVYTSPKRPEDFFKLILCKNSCTAAYVCFYPIKLHNAEKV